MISQVLASLEQELRGATSRRQYAEVQRLLVSIGTAASHEAHVLPVGDPRVYEIAAWLNQLWDWTDAALRASRAAHAAELRCIPFVKTYLQQRSLSIP